MGVPIQTRTRLNLMKQCDYRKNGIGCTRKRKAIARYCEDHWDRLATTGHLDGRLIPRSTYRPLQAHALRYITSHQDHPLIIKALDHIRAQVINPGRMPNPPYRKPRRSLSQIIEQQTYLELRRLQTPVPLMKGNGTAGKTVTVDRPDPVSAEEVLAVCVGVWLAVQLDSRLLINDGECMNFALANGVLLLRMYRRVVAWGAEGRSASSRPPGARVRRALGEILRTLSFTYNQIAEKLAPIALTPEQIRAAIVDTLPLPEATPDERVIPLPVEPVAPVPAPRLTHYQLPPRYPRPMMRDIHSPALIAKWQENEKLWQQWPDGKIPITYKEKAS